MITLDYIKISPGWVLPSMGGNFIFDPLPIYLYIDCMQISWMCTYIFACHIIHPTFSCFCSLSFWLVESSFLRLLWMGLLHSLFYIFWRWMIFRQQRYSYLICVNLHLYSMTFVYLNAIIIEVKCYWKCISSFYWQIWSLSSTYLIFIDKWKTWLLLCAFLAGRFI